MLFAKKILVQISKIVNHFFQKLEYSTGKNLFGNTSGIKNNIRGFMQVRPVPQDI